MDQPKNLLSIGMFADLSRLSIKALRLYDGLGILRPLHIDPQSGYRYYGVDQLPEARMIRKMTATRNLAISRSLYSLALLR